MRQRLRRAGLDDATIETVLEQLRGHALVDDAAFAEYWVEQRQTFRPRGARLLKAELARLGVGRAQVDTATDTLESTAVEDAYRAAARRARQLRHLDDAAFQTRMGQWLARRGFAWDTITSVVARLGSERDGATIGPE